MFCFRFYKLGIYVLQVQITCFFFFWYHDFKISQNHDSSWCLWLLMYLCGLHVLLSIGFNTKGFLICLAWNWEVMVQFLEGNFFFHLKKKKQRISLFDVGWRKIFLFVSWPGMRNWYWFMKTKLLPCRFHMVYKFVYLKH